MGIDYNHSKNVHTLNGAASALRRLLSAAEMPKSILDVGCGTGTWLRVALDLGVTDIFGIDGVEITSHTRLIDQKYIQKQDLTAPVDLNRKFDVVLCLEVAEHLDAKFAPVLIETLTKHSDHILFSAACPGQPGQHHVNCQWPEYWQELFNRLGFACDDSLRWQIWSDKSIEPWYRQNLFSAVKDAVKAGKEARIHPVIHPDINGWIFPEVERFAAHVRQIENGHMPVKWYIGAPMVGMANKIKRHI